MYFKRYVVGGKLCSARLLPFSSESVLQCHPTMLSCDIVAEHRMIQRLRLRVRRPPTRMLMDIVPPLSTLCQSNRITQVRTAHVIPHRYYLYSVWSRFSVEEYQVKLPMTLGARRQQMSLEPDLGFPSGREVPKSSSKMHYLLVLLNQTTMIPITQPSSSRCAIYGMAITLLSDILRLLPCRDSCVLAFTLNGSSGCPRCHRAPNLWRWRSKVARGYALQVPDDRHRSTKSVDDIPR